MVSSRSRSAPTAKDPAKKSDQPSNNKDVVDLKRVLKLKRVLEINQVVGEWELAIDGMEDLLRVKVLKREDGTYLGLSNYETIYGTQSCHIEMTAEDALI